MYIEPINCVWNDWQIGECSEECAGGTRINTRTKKWEAMYGGTCEGNSTLDESCNAHECPGNLYGSKRLYGYGIISSRNSFYININF